MFCEELSMSYLKNVIILCGTNNIFVDSPYDIAQCLIDIGVCFPNCSLKFEIFHSGSFLERVLLSEQNINQRD